jgi:polysulfide reductase chain C
MTPLQSTWGWLIAWYLFLAGVGAGAYIVSVLADFLGFKSKLASKIGVALGAPLVLIGTVLLFLDLGQPANFIYIFNNPSSMITVGSAILTVFIVVGAVHIGFWIWPFKALEKAQAARRALSLLGLVFAFGTAIYTGVLLGVVEAIPFWNTAILPMLFLISALSTGFAAVILGLSMFYGRRTGEEQKSILESMKALAKSDAVLVGAELLAVLFYLLIESSAGPTAYESVQLLISGALAPVFLGGLVAFGLIVPLALESYEGFAERRMSSALLVTLSMLSGVLLLAGGLILRQSVLAAGVSEAAPFTTTTPVYGLGLMDYVMTLAFPVLLLLVYGVSKAIPTGKKATSV